MVDLVIIEIIMMIRGISFVISSSTRMDESLVPGGKLLTVRSYSGQLSAILMDLQSSIGQWQKMNGNVVLLGTTYHFSKNVVCCGGVVLLHIACHGVSHDAPHP